MDKDLKNKLYANALIVKNLDRLNRSELQTILSELSESYSFRELEVMFGIPKSTLHHWSQGRDRRGQKTIVDLGSLYTRLCQFEPSEITDWGRVEMIKDKCEELLRLKERGVVKDD